MPSAPYLDPLPDNVGSREELLRADELARHSPAELTDRHIRLLACYGASGAKAAYDARAKALAAVQIKAAEAPAQSHYGLNDLARDLATDTKQFVRESLEAQLAGAVVNAIKAAVAPLDKRIADLEQQFVTLKGQETKGIDQGVWQAGAVYRNSDLVTDRGSLWIAKQVTSERPGDSAHWRLAAKGRS